MKKITVFETSVLGFFVGIVVSSYISFLSSTDSFIGFILNWISLRPALSYIAIPDQHTLVGSFIFFVFVYTIYGAIIGLFIQKTSNAHKIILPLLLITLLSGGFEQTVRSASYIPQNSSDGASVIQAIPKVQKQYFGTEAYGDLNGDSVDDIAFLIQRNDERGAMYYLTSALSAPQGKIGTNLIYLGTGVVPQNISINNGFISIVYTKDDTEGNLIQAGISDGTLEFIDIPEPTI